MAVISPRYVKSEWGRKELTAFIEAAREQGGLAIGDKSRIFKVLKTPVPLDEHPAELQPLLGYEFFRRDPETGKVRELNAIFGPDAEREFGCDWTTWQMTFAACSSSSTPEHRRPRPGRPRFSSRRQPAICASKRDALKRDLLQHGYEVLPTHPLPMSSHELDIACGAISNAAPCRCIWWAGRTASFRKTA